MDEFGMGYILTPALTHTLFINFLGQQTYSVILVLCTTHGIEKNTSPVTTVLIEKTVVTATSLFLEAVLGATRLIN